MGCYIWGVINKFNEVLNMPRSIAEIDKITAVELRKIASDMMQKNPSLVYMKDGKELTAGEVRRGGKKKDLVEHISKWEQLLDNKRLKTEKPIESKSFSQNKETPVNSESSYNQSEQERLDIAKKFYYSTFDKDGLTGLKEYQLKLCKSGKYFLPEYGTLVARARVLIESYANEKSPEGKAHPGTVQKIRVEVMKKLKELIENEKDKFEAVNDRTIVDLFKDFENDLRGAFKDIGGLKYQLNKEKNEKAEEDVREIKAYDFINWAIERVNNLPKSPAKWKEVSIALMLLTGRRQSEIMSSGIFTYVNDSTVVFQGQLKRHTDEIVEAKKIPVLGKCAKQIIKAIEWLEINNKRTIPTEYTSEAIQKAAKISHNRCSRYISETMVKLQKLCPITNNKDWVGEDGKNRFKGHLCRQIYAEICGKLFTPDNYKERAFISHILIENRNAALNYLRDLNIIDIDKIKNVCGNFSS